MPITVLNGSGTPVDIDSKAIAGEERSIGFGINRSGRGVFRPTLTVTASAYGDDYCVGTKFTLSNVLIEAGRQATLTHLVVKEKTGKTPHLLVLFFRANPSGGTYADHGAFAWGAADLMNLIDGVEVTPDLWRVVAGKSWAGLGVPGQDHDSTDANVYGLVIHPAGSSPAYTPTATDALSVEPHYHLS